MILENELYDIVSADTESRRFRIALRPESVIYQAHFPGMPVTPGVCMIQAAVELASRVPGIPANLREVVNAKFLAILSPADTPEADVTITRVAPAVGPGVRIQAAVTYGDTTYARLSLILDDNDDLSDA